MTMPSVYYRTSGYLSRRYTLSQAGIYTLRDNLDKTLEAGLSPYLTDLPT